MNNSAPQNNELWYEYNNKANNIDNNPQYNQNNADDQQHFYNFQNNIYGNNQINNNMNMNK